MNKVSSCPLTLRWGSSRRPCPSYPLIRLTWNTPQDGVCDDTQKGHHIWTCKNEISIFLCALSHPVKSLDVLHVPLLGHASICRNIFDCKCEHSPILTRAFSAALISTLPSKAEWIMAPVMSRKGTSRVLIYILVKVLFPQGLALSKAGS